MELHYAVVPLLIVLSALLVSWLSIRRIVSVRTRNFDARRRATEGIALWLVSAVALLLAASSVVNLVEFIRFRHAPPGRIYQVNGRGMRLDCTGGGAPTIILDAGLGNDGLIWGGVQPVLAATTRVCSYDRAGRGWSDSEPTARDADHIADDLHGLLAAARIDGPVVLMGHSIAGIYIRDFATRYPAGVAGLIFVDGSTPLQERDPAFEAHLSMHFPALPQVLLIEAELGAGIPRWMGLCSHPPGWPDRHAAWMMVEDRCYPGIAESLNEGLNMDRSGEETVHTGPSGDLPILIFSHDPAKVRAEHMPGDVVDAWERMQQNLLKLSVRSRRIIARDSGHYIQFDRPELMEQEVRLFIQQIRGTAPQPTDYGSTVTE